MANDREIEIARRAGGDLAKGAGRDLAPGAGREIAKDAGRDGEREIAKAEAPPADPRALPSMRLVGETAREAIALIKAQVDLAKAELKEDLRSEAAAAKGLSVAAVAGLCGLNLLLVAAAFGLAAVLPAWAALLIVAGVVLLVAGIAAAIGMKKLRVPLQRTRKSLQEDVQWVKERTA